MYTIGKNGGLSPFSAYPKIFDLRKVPSFTICPLSLNVNNANINTKSTIFKKMGLKIWNPKFKGFFWQNYIYKLATLWNSEVNKAVLEQVKGGGMVIIIYFLIF